MEKFSVCIAGGGSRYTPGIINMLVSQRDRFPLKRLVLFDCESERQAKVAAYARILFDENYPDCEVVETCDIDSAFADVDFVFLQIRAGRMAMREKDEKIAIAHGCVGQETCGPGGFAYALRSVPAVCEITRAVRRQSPDAWILNYTNPDAIVAEAMRQVFPDDDRIICICDMPIGLTEIFEYLLDPEGEEGVRLDARYFGLNHFGWFEHLYDQSGRDRLDEVREIIANMDPIQPGVLGLDEDWTFTFNFMQTQVRDLPDYIPNNYLQYYLYPKAMFAHQDPNYTRANMVMDGDERETFEMLDRVAALGHIKGTEFESEAQSIDGHGEYIVDLALALAYGTGDDFVLMTVNDGIIPNLSPDMVVEVPCRVSADGVRPYRQAPAPTFQKGLMENQHAYERLTVEACLEGSYVKALQALTLNRCVNDLPTARALLDDYMVANEGWWPELR